jgi:hypothetical protein
MLDKMNKQSIVACATTSVNNQEYNCMGKP